MIAGLAISIPLVIFGATILLKLMERWPIIITIGAGLLGFVAGEMAWQDSALDGLTSAYGPSARYIPAIAGTALVVIVGRILAGRTLERAAREQLENLEAVEHPRQHARKEPVH
jgi:predicted tellurium resistance membrane protein TerC